MDEIVKTSAELFTCHNNYRRCRTTFLGYIFSVSVQMGVGSSISCQARRKELVLFIHKEFLHFLVYCSSLMKPVIASSQVALQLCARTCKAFQPFTQYISLSNKSSQAFLSKALLLVKEWRTASFDNAREKKKKKALMGEPASFQGDTKQRKQGDAADWYSVRLQAGIGHEIPLNWGSLTPLIQKPIEVEGK